MILEFIGNNDTILLFGAIVLFLVSYLIPWTEYKFPIQLVAVAAIGGLLFLSGQAKSDREWEQKMSDARERISQLEKRSPEVSIQVVTEYIDRIKYIDRPTVHTVKEFITVEVDKACTINRGFERLYDAAVKNDPIKPEPTDSEPTDLVLSDIATIDSHNIKQFHKLKAQNDSLKKWIKEQEKLWDEYRQSSSH